MTLNDLKNYTLSDKIFDKVDNDWVIQNNGKLCIAYQTNENGYNARSFEDAFIHINRNFVNTNKNEFKGLKNKNSFDDTNIDAYDFSNCEYIQCKKLDDTENNKQKEIKTPHL